MTAKLTSNNDCSKARKAIFAGSFNPFTVGHASIVERGLELFDHIYIVVGTNAEKPNSNAEEIADSIRTIYNMEPRVSVIVWNGLMVDLACKENVKFFLRGIRNATDFEYERNMADVNRMLAGIETVFFPTLPEHGAISSSIVRELKNYGRDVSKLVP